MADGFSESLGVYSSDRTRKGGVWRGGKAIVAYVDGSVRIEGVDKGSLSVSKMRGGSIVQLFSEEYGIDPDNIKNPE
jgi:prepilin-type processing-associated H-X9-DG protein